MPIREDVKGAFERLTGYARPKRRDLQDVVRTRKPRPIRLPDDGRTPNNPILPLIVYRSPVRLAPAFDPAAIFEELFAANGWRDSWRDGIYDFLHYHSRIHEVLGIARGKVRVEFGGSKGRRVELRAGDVAVLPAGTGHRRLSASKDLLVVGAYPNFGKYDECRSVKRDHDRAILTIPKVPRPKKDPVYGTGGPLLQLWRAS